MSRLVRALVAIVAIAASVGMTRSAPAAAAPGRSLFLVADSVALGAAPAIRAAFAGWSVAIEGHQGIFTDDAAELAWAHRDEVGDLAVVATGYNYPVWNPALFDGWIDQMMGRLVDGGARHVFWLTLREPPLGEHGVVSVWEKSGIADHYPQANAQLRAATTRWPQLALADWNAVAGAPGLTWDGLHVTPAGGAAMADLLVDEVGGIGRLPAGGTLRLAVSPETASAALNLTATWPRGAGYLTAWPCDEPRPLASNLNFTRHQTVANLALTRVAADGSVCVYASEATHVVADLEATFAAGAGVHTVNPVRVLDTRSGGTRPAAGATVAVAVTGPGAGAGIPSGAAAVVATVTATDATAAGFVTAWPCGTPRPTTSVLNHDAGAPVAGLAVVPLGPDGSACLFTLAGAHLVVDVTGWLDAGAAWQAVVPARLADTRATARRLAAGGVLAVPVPAGAGTVAVTATAVEPAGPGYLTVFPCGTPPPTASALNYEASPVVANLAVVAAGAGGQICLTSYAPADVVVDLGAWAPATAGGPPSGPVRLADTRLAVGP
jgi:hypothetical protein